MSGDYFLYIIFKEQTPVNPLSNCQKISAKFVKDINTNEKISD